jgi:uncharacterized protein DUF6597
LRAMLLAHRPSAPLASHVEKLWYCDGQQVVPRIERIMPNARFQLVMSLAESPLHAPAGPSGEWGEIAPSLVLGIRSRYSLVDTTRLRCAIGVVFRPGGGRAFLDAPADAFYNEM